jgi:hypothetical protein
MKIYPAAIAVMPLCIAFPIRITAADISAVSAPPVFTDVSQSAQIPAPIRDWTVMVYMAGQNNLVSSAAASIAQMEKTGSTKSVNVIVEMGIMAEEPNPCLYRKIHVTTAANRYLITKSTDNFKTGKAGIISPILATATGYYNVDIRSVENFANWAKQNYPARHYAMILWDHKNDLIDINKKTHALKHLLTFDPAVKCVYGDLSFEDPPPENAIAAQEIAEILSDIGGVDIIAYDAGLMQFGELAAEIQNYAKYSVGSEEAMQEKGLNYATFLQKLTNTPDTSPEEAAFFLMQAFADSYAKTKQPATVSLINNAAVAGFEKLLDQWVDIAMQSKDTASIKAARDGVLRLDEFGDQDAQRVLSTYGDAYNFFQLVSENTNYGELKKASNELMIYIKNRLVVQNFATGTNGRFQYKNAHGIAINIPRLRSDITEGQLENKYFGANYADFKFALETKWYEFFKWMMNSIPPTKSQIKIKLKNRPA